MNEEQLILRLSALRNGEKDALEDIYQGLKNPLFTIIFRIIKNRSEAEDILQDLFVRLYETPLGNDIRKPRAYLFMIARNMAIDHLRQQKNNIDLDEAEDVKCSDTEDWSQKMDIENALKTLSVTDNEIITLHINCGMKFREISEITNLPLGTVLWRYRKSIDQLRNLLDGGAL